MTVCETALWLYEQGKNQSLLKTSFKIFIEISNYIFLFPHTFIKMTFWFLKIILNVCFFSVLHTILL